MTPIQQIKEIKMIKKRIVEIEKFLNEKEKLDSNIEFEIRGALNDFKDLFSNIFRVKKVVREELIMLFNIFNYQVKQIQVKEMIHHGKY